MGNRGPSDESKRSSRGMLFSAHRLPSQNTIERKGEIPPKLSLPQSDVADEDEDKDKEMETEVRPCFDTLASPVEVESPALTGTDKPVDEADELWAELNSVLDESILPVTSTSTVEDIQKVADSAPTGDGVDKESEKLSLLKAKLRRLEADIQEQKKRRQTNNS